MPENPTAAFKALVELTDVLIDRLANAEEENASTALTVLLIGAVTSLGPASTAMQQFFPVLDGIKGHVDASNLDVALRETRLFKAKLEEIIDVIRRNAPVVGSDPAQVDLSFRPKSYFGPLGPEKQLLTHIKGTARRAQVQRFIDAGQADQIPVLLAKSGLSKDERRSLGRVNPMFMGGEYLPNQEEDEVEVARIEINSTSFDVTSVYARRDTSLIHYRVVDEYEGDTLTGPNTRESAEPLTLGELEDFFLGAWSLSEVLEANFGRDVKRMLGFFRATSEFYPDLDRLLRQRVIEKHARDASAENEKSQEEE